MARRNVIFFSDREMPIREKHPHVMSHTASVLFGSQQHRGSMYQLCSLGRAKRNPGLRARRELPKAPLWRKGTYTGHFEGVHTAPAAKSLPEISRCARNDPAADGTRSDR